MPEMAATPRKFLTVSDLTQISARPIFLARDSLCISTAKWTMAGTLLPSAGGRNQRQRRERPNLYILPRDSVAGEREGRQPSHVDDSAEQALASTPLDTLQSICAVGAAR